MNTTKLYCLSGLGVDHRAYRNIHIEGVELIHIAWINPERNESLTAYAKRLFDSANLPTDYHLIGVSFGGMIAQEFEKIRKPQTLYLISTISDASELPMIFRLGGKLRLHKILPTSLLKQPNWLMYHFFGAKEKKDKALLMEILKDTHELFLRWSMNAILTWKNADSSNGIRIHGEADKILPLRIKPHVSIPKAGHFMIITHGAEMSKHISCG